MAEKRDLAMAHFKYIDLNLILQHLCDTPKYISFNPDKFDHTLVDLKNRP